MRCATIVAAVAVAVLAGLPACGRAPANGPEPDGPTLAESDSIADAVLAGTRDVADERQWRGTNPTRVEDLLVGRFAGVEVTRGSTGALVVRIRGGSSLRGDGQPLYVIDDQIIEPGPGGALMGINPWDIARIRVLKDPADIGIYGSRGGNGVIVITTRHGP